MHNAKMKWSLVALLVVLGLGLLVRPPVPRQKAQPQRIHSVNTVAKVSFNMPITNAQPAAVSNK